MSIYIYIYIYIYTYILCACTLAKVHACVRACTCACVEIFRTRNTYVMLTNTSHSADYPCPRAHTLTHTGSHSCSGRQWRRASRARAFSESRR